MHVHISPSFCKVLRSDTIQTEAGPKSTDHPVSVSDFSVLVFILKKSLCTKLQPKEKTTNRKCRRQLGDPTAVKSGSIAGMSQKGCRHVYVDLDGSKCSNSFGFCWSCQRFFRPGDVAARRFRVCSGWGFLAFWPFYGWCSCCHFKRQTIAFRHTLPDTLDKVLRVNGFSPPNVSPQSNFSTTSLQKTGLHLE